MSQESFDFDQVASHYLDSITYREEAARLKIKLGENELEAAAFMRNELMRHLVKSNGVDTDTHDVAVDPGARKLIVTPRAPAPASDGTKVERK